AYTADELIAFVGETEVDVVVMDGDLSTTATGVDVFERLRSEHPSIGVVVVSGTVDRERARRCIALGLRAYVVKQDRHDPERIAAAVRHTARGKPFFAGEIQEFLIDLAASAPDPALEAGLTSRER